VVSQEAAKVPGYQQGGFRTKAGAIKKGEQQNMSKKVEIKWLSEPEAQDYPAALSYLCLIYQEKQAALCERKLKAAALVQFKAKDIFRASGLSMVGISNAHVERDQEKIESGQGLSPLLLVRDSANGKVVIADGYHRLCAVYSYSEDAVIPCKIV
jgi:disulfide oxidoreductase YuzD